jgi:hypothetical protein
MLGWRNRLREIKADLITCILLVAGFSDRSNWAMRRRNGGFPRRAVAASGQTGQDKLAELREARFRRRACRQLTFCDVDADSKRL